MRKQQKGGFDGCVGFGIDVVATRYLICIGQGV